MYEARKTTELRGEEFTRKYFRGRVIDIGAGRDLVCDWAEGFDVQDGDANFITRYRQSNSYDAVHSSHCLEHMYDPTSALLNWWSLLKPGGFLIIVVPDEDLYEQGMWPSVFNSDHKSTFRLGKDESWSPVSFDIRALINNLPNSEILSAERQARGYKYQFQSKRGDKVRHMRWLPKIYHWCSLIPVFGKGLLQLIQLLAFRFRVPVDQTLGVAVAQVQVVAQKRL